MIRRPPRSTLFPYTTPLPISGNGRLENASVLQGVDTVTWIEPQQASNPIVSRPPKGWMNNSDPDLSWDAGSHRYFFSNRQASTDSNAISVFGTADGAHFSAGRRIIGVPSHQVVSPSFTVGHDGQPRLYSVNAATCGDDNATVEVRRPLNSSGRYEDIDWGAPEAVSLDQPRFVPWHLEIRWVRKLKLYVGLVVAHPVGDS